MHLILLLVVLTLGLIACEQNIGGNGGLAGSDRPSIVAACSQDTQLNSTPKPRHDRDPVVVNIPRPEPTVRCSKGGAAEEE